MGKETYTIENVCRILNNTPGIQVKGKVIKTMQTAIIGTKTWGKIDFLKKNGYTHMFVATMENKKESKGYKEDSETPKRRKKNNGIDALTNVKSIMKMSNFKIKK